MNMVKRLIANGSNLYGQKSSSSLVQHQSRFLGMGLGGVRGGHFEVIREGIQNSIKQPRVFYDKKIATVKDALQAFDEMINRNNLPDIEAFNKLFQFILKKRDYTSVLVLYKKGMFDVYTIGVAVKTSFETIGSKYAFGILGTSWSFT